MEKWVSPIKTSQTTCSRRQRRKFNYWQVQCGKTLSSPLKRFPLAYWSSPVVCRILGKRIKFCSTPINRQMLPTFVQACLALGPIPLQSFTDFEGGHINFLLWLTLSIRNAIIAMLTPPRKIKNGMIKLSSDNGPSLILVGIVQDTGSLAWISLSIFAWIPQAISHEIAVRSSSCNETNQKNI